MKRALIEGPVAVRMGPCDSGAYLAGTGQVVGPHRHCLCRGAVRRRPASARFIGALQGQRFRLTAGAGRLRVRYSRLKRSRIAGSQPLANPDSRTRWPATDFDWEGARPVGRHCCRRPHTACCYEPGAPRCLCALDGRRAVPGIYSVCGGVASGQLLASSMVIESTDAGNVIISQLSEDISAEIIAMLSHSREHLSGVTLGH